MKIVQLTLLDGRKVFINFNLVTDFTLVSDKKTLICFGKEDYHFQVVETPEYIMQCL